MSDPRSTAQVCPSCGRLVNAQVRQCPHCGRLAPTLYGANRWLDRLFQGRQTMSQWITMATLLVTGLVFVHTAIAQGPGSLFAWDTVHAWNRFGRLDLDLVVSHHQWWRMFTWLFLHANLMHVALNMLFLVWFGNQVEAVYGRGRLVLIYFGSGLGAAVASMYHHAGTGGTSIGASGAVFGLVGTLLAYGLRRRDEIGRQIVGRILFFVLLNLMLSLPSDQPIDHFAHGGGLVAGFLIGRLMRTRDQTRRGEGPGVRLAALLTLAMAATSLGIGALQGTPGAASSTPDPLLRGEWMKFMSNLGLIQRQAGYLDRGRKAEISRTMSAFRALFEEEAGRMGDDGQWLRDLLEDWKALNEELVRGASAAVIRDHAGRILQRMQQTPVPW